MSSLALLTGASLSDDEAETNRTRELHFISALHKEILMKRRYLTLFVLLTLILSSAPPNASAQSDSGSINGQITDPGGAVIQGAMVTITDLGTNGVVSTTTNANGQYAFSTLRASRYKITVSAPGFKETVIPDIDLHTQDKTSENVRSRSVSSNDSVTVSADSSAQIETSASVATTVDRQFIENMPLNGRSFQALISLTPGNVTAKTFYTASGQFSIDGQRTDANYFSIDGVSANVGITQGSNVYLGSAGAGALRQQATTAATTTSSPSTTCRSTRFKPTPSMPNTAAPLAPAFHRHPQRHQPASTELRSNTSATTSSTPTTGSTTTKVLPARPKSRTTSAAFSVVRSSATSSSSSSPTKAFACASRSRRSTSFPPALRATRPAPSCCHCWRPTRSLRRPGYRRELTPVSSSPPSQILPP